MQHCGAVLDTLPLPDQARAGYRSVIGPSLADQDVAAVQLFAQGFQPLDGFRLQTAIGKFLNAVGEPALPGSVGCRVAAPFRKARATGLSDPMWEWSSAPPPWPGPYRSSSLRPSFSGAHDRSWQACSRASSLRGVQIKHWTLANGCASTQPRGLRPLPRAVHRPSCGSGRKGSVPLATLCTSEKFGSSRRTRNANRRQIEITAGSMTWRVPAQTKETMRKAAGPISVELPIPGDQPRTGVACLAR